MPKIVTMPAYRDRHPKDVESARCCWVCGKVGGAGFTAALAGAGYRMRRGEMGYAHPNCMARAMKQAAKIENDRLREALRLTKSDLQKAIKEINRELV